MSILLPDIDHHIIEYMTIPTMITLGRINKYYQQFIVNKPVIMQWKDVNNRCPNIGFKSTMSLNELFLVACANGYLDYVKYLFANHHIYGDFSDEFYWSCYFGHFKLAQFLIEFKNLHGQINIDVRRIRIYGNKDNPLISCILNNDDKIAKWLIDVSKTENYGEYTSENLRECLKCIDKKNQNKIIQWLKGNTDIKIDF